MRPRGCRTRFSDWRLHADRPGDLRSMANRMQPNADSGRCRSASDLVASYGPGRWPSATTGDDGAFGPSGTQPKLAPHDEAIRARVAAPSGCDARGAAGLGLRTNARSRSASAALWNRLEVSRIPLEESLRASEQDRAGCRRGPRSVGVADQPELKSERLVFIKQTCAATNIAQPLQPAVRAASTLVSSVPSRHGKTTTATYPRSDSATTPAPCVLEQTRWNQKAFALISRQFRRPNP